MKLNLIVACCNNNGIGKNNSLPWELKTDIAYFKKITTFTTNPVLKNVVIMGRKTWESIPEKYRPLENRINIVLTRNKNYKIHQDGLVCSNLDHSMDVIDTIPNSNKNNIFVIGGESVYSETIKHKNINKIYLTKIYDDYKCDRFFPAIPSNLVLTSVSKFIEERGVYYRNLVYVNKLNNTNVNTWKNNEEMQYIHCLKNILDTGYEKHDRTGVGTISSFGNMFKYDLNDTFPLLTTKKMWVRAIFEELKFYLSGKTDNNILNDKKITIWTGNTTREFLDKKNLSHYPVNDMGESYGFNFRHFGAEYKTCHENYEGQGFDQIEYVIDLIKNDPHSRRIIIDLWNCSTLHKAALPPCLCKYQFFCNTHDKKLDLMIYLRSSDFFLANNWNVCTGAFFIHMLCSLDDIDFTPGTLTVVTADTHIYKTHLKQVNENLLRTPRPYPKLIVLNRHKSITDFEFSDFKLVGYDPYPNIKATMAI
jgi:dihydrofolate reductase / thymidylate synthase